MTDMGIMNNEAVPGILTGERIQLRAVEPDDAWALWVMETDSTQWLFNGMMAPFSMRNIKEYALDYDPDPYRTGQLRLIAQIRRPQGDWSNDVVGMVDLYDVSAHDHNAWVGIYVRPGFRDRGYATEMLDIMERYAHRMLNIRTLAAKVAQGNEASMRLFQSARYIKRGALLNWMEIDSKFHDVYYFQKNLKQLQNA